MIIQDDVIHWAETYEGEPFHALLTDCPYHLTSIVARFGKENSKPAKGDVYRRSSAGFMSQVWDSVDEDGNGISFRPETWHALASHLYPGGFGMTFASPRTQHRIACAIEDAGLIIQPTIYLWGYLSGFPKATRVKGWYGTEAFNGHRYGGQALKPSVEPIILWQCPYSGRPIENIVETGAGALWIDGGRIPTGDNLDGGGYMTTVGEGWDRPWRHNDDIREEKERLKDERVDIAQKLGRWPSNLILHCSCSPTRPDKSIHDESCAAAVLDGQSGELKSGGGDKHSKTQHGRLFGLHPISGLRDYESDSGPASRMFYQSSWAYEVAEQLAAADSIRYEPKASSNEREIGLDGFEKKRAGSISGGGSLNSTNDHAYSKNIHPTVKPISITKYLATLLLPPAQYAPRRILIPFCGVASEYIGAMLAGWEEIVGIEREANYVEIARGRAKWWSQWPGWGQTDVDKILAISEEEKQLKLF